MLKAIKHLEMLASDWEEYPLGDDKEDRTEMAHDLLDALAVIKASLLYEELSKSKYTDEDISVDDLISKTGIHPNKNKIGGNNGL